MHHHQGKYFLQYYVNGPTENVAIVVFKRQVLWADTREGWDLVTVVNAGILLLVRGPEEGVAVYGWL